MVMPKTPKATFVARRRLLAGRFPGPAIFAAGLPQARNYANNLHPFRATSHFLYLIGEPLAGAALLLKGGEATLFVPLPAADAALWHGPSPSLDALRERLAVDAVRPLEELDQALDALGSVATLPPNDEASAAWISQRVRRPVGACSGAALDEGSDDALLAGTMVALRLQHDSAAIDQLRSAADATVAAHRAGMRATRTARTEAEVAGAMSGALRARGLVDAYLPIVTTHGEVLHNEHHVSDLHPGDLILADVGGETPEGWAADVTRVWPVSGRFSPTQRAVYEVVLEAQRAAIALVRPGVRYRDIHLAAARSMVAGLSALGIFKGDIDGLLERGAAAIFFPHGIGHLLGLDVHDMEDLGDRAGYAPGRTRSERFGERYLRLDRDLVAGMAVTIEPGFYQVPAILADPHVTGAVGKDLDLSVLARFGDVRGIRIEDDVLCTEGLPEVLTRAAPKDPAEVEAAIND